MINTLYMDTFMHKKYVHYLHFTNKTILLKHTLLLNFDFDFLHFL
jgi:hypothetical protein